MAALREGGEAAAHAGILAERVLDRYLSTLWAIWEFREAEPWDRDVITHLARRLLHGGDVMVAAVASGYRAVDRELVARDVEARRTFLEELLGSVAVDVSAIGRLRRHALGRGLDPDGSFRLVAIAADLPDDELDEVVHRLGRAGENMREAARRLHLGNRTVAYRLERIESLLGGRLDGTRRERLVVALLARRVLERTTRP